MSTQYRKQRTRHGSLLLLFVLLVSAPLALGQDYTIEEFNEYQKASEEGDDALIAFIGKYPQSSLKDYAVNAYLQRLQGYVDQAQHQEAVEAGEKFLNAVDAERFEVLFLTTWSAFYSQQYEKAVKYGAIVYATKPDSPQIVPIMARGYLNSGNIPGAIEFGVKYCAEVAPEECYDLLPTIMRHYAEKKEWAKAEQYAKLTVEAFDKVPKPDQVAEGEWQSFVNEEKAVAHSIMGKQAYEGKKWNSAERNYTIARQLTPKNKLRAAEGYYYTGMSRWSEKKIDPAMESFARGSLLDGTAYTDPCRKQLEQLYRATHNGSLAGLDEYLERYK